MAAEEAVCSPAKDVQCNGVEPEAPILPGALVEEPATWDDIDQKTGEVGSLDHQGRSAVSVDTANVADSAGEASSAEKVPSVSVVEETAAKKQTAATSPTSPKAPEAPRCYICGGVDGQRPGAGTGAGNASGTRIVRACCCEGREKYVHQGCLQRKRSESSPWSASFWECEICGASYRMRSRRHYLRFLTSVPALALVCGLHGLVSLLMASEFFKRAMPSVLRWIGELDEKTPSQIQLKIFGIELGYWAGGLLMLTFLHKLLDRNWTGLIQFMPLFQISIRSTNEDQLSDLKVGVWYFLCLYSCYAACRFFNDSFVFLHLMLSSLVGEEVLDFVSDTCRSSANAEDDSAYQSVSADEELCICCMDMPVNFQMSECGHLVSCTLCRPRLVYHRLKKQAGGTRAIPPMRMMGKDHLERTIIKCPMCRTDGKLVRRSSVPRQTAEAQEKSDAKDK